MSGKKIGKWQIENRKSVNIEQMKELDVCVCVLANKIEGFTNDQRRKKNTKPKYWMNKEI